MLAVGYDPSRWLIDCRVSSTFEGVDGRNKLKQMVGAIAGQDSEVIFGTEFIRSAYHKAVGGRPFGLVFEEAGPLGRVGFSSVCSGNMSNDDFVRHVVEFFKHGAVGFPYDLRCGYEETEACRLHREGMCSRKIGKRVCPHSVLVRK